MLDVRRMKMLREVARRGSFSAAAEVLSFTQSAIPSMPMIVSPPRPQRSSIQAVQLNPQKKRLWLAQYP